MHITLRFDQPSRLPRLYCNGSVSADHASAVFSLTAAAELLLYMAWAWSLRIPHWAKINQFLIAVHSDDKHTKGAALQDIADALWLFTKLAVVLQLLASALHAARTRYIKARGLQQGSCSWREQLLQLALTPLMAPPYVMATILFWCASAPCSRLGFPRWWLLRLVWPIVYRSTPEHRKQM
jgi:hypothetical protein